MAFRSNRRKFLLNSLLTGLGAGLTPLAFAEKSPELPDVKAPDNPDVEDTKAPVSGTISLLQTTDVHCQIHPHD